jgi:hypothetical protein
MTNRRNELTPEEILAQSEYDRNVISSDELPRTCIKCGALILITEVQKHAGWHKEINVQLQALFDFEASVLKAADIIRDAYQFTSRVRPPRE